MSRTEFVVKLHNFSLCEIFSKDEQVVDQQLHDFRGSPDSSPECLVQESHCGFKADVFSVGCIALELLPSSFNKYWMSCYHNLRVEGKADFVAKIGEGIKAVRTEVQQVYTEPNGPLDRKHSRPTNKAPVHNISPMLGTFLLEQALELQPRDRPSATELLSNLWCERARSSKYWTRFIIAATVHILTFLIFRSQIVADHAKGGR